MPKRTHLSPTYLKNFTLAALLSITHVACSGDDPAVPTTPDGGTMDAASCPTSGTGTLVLTVNAPVTLSPTVRALGGAAPIPLIPGTPVSVPAGSYRIEAGRTKVAPTPPALIGTAYYASGIAFDGCVRNGMTSPVTVTYAQEPGSGKIWTTPANGAGAVVAYDESQLRAGTAQAPTVIRRMGITSAADIAFDARGNLWVYDRGVGGGLLGYRMETLGMPDRPADLKLTGLEGLRALAFDANGDLWATQNVPSGSDRIIRLAMGDLAFGAGAAPTTRPVSPSRILYGTEINDPSDLAFDATGNLWVASTGRDVLVRLTPAQLAAGGEVTPGVLVRTRRATGPVQGSYDGPASLAFDAAGNLWSAWNAGGALLRLTPAQQAASGTVDDPTELEPMGAGPAGVSRRPHAFDWTAGMWLSRTNIGGPAALVRVPAAGVTAGGKQATSPDMPSEGLGNGAGSIVINPAPTGLPIFD